LVIGKNEDLYTAVPLTTYLQLAITDRYPPLVEWRGFNFVPLPFWIYANERILERFSVPVFRLKSIDTVKQYVHDARTEGIGYWREKFIKKVARRFRDINISSVLYDVAKAEE